MKQPVFCKLYTSHFRAQNSAKSTLSLEALRQAELCLYITATVYASERLEWLVSQRIIVIISGQYPSLSSFVYCDNQLEDPLVAYSFQGLRLSHENG